MWFASLVGREVAALVWPCLRSKLIEQSDVSKVPYPSATALEQCEGTKPGEAGSSADGGCVPRDECTDGKLGRKQPNGCRVGQQRVKYSFHKSQYSVDLIAGRHHSVSCSCEKVTLAVHCAGTISCCGPREDQDRVWSPRAGIIHSECLVILTTTSCHRFAPN